MQLLPLNPTTPAMDGCGCEARPVARYLFSVLLRVGTSRCDVPARVQRAEGRLVTVPRSARLNGAGTPQRGVLCHFEIFAICCGH